MAYCFHRDGNDSSRRDHLQLDGIRIDWAAVHALGRFHVCFRPSEDDIKRYFLLVLRRYTTIVCRPEEFWSLCRDTRHKNPRRSSVQGRPGLSGDFVSDVVVDGDVYGPRQSRRDDRRRVWYRSNHVGEKGDGPLQRLLNRQVLHHFLHLAIVHRSGWDEARTAVMVLAGVHLSLHSGKLAPNRVLQPRHRSATSDHRSAYRDHRSKTRLVIMAVA